jgi:hypothetical protein
MQLASLTLNTNGDYLSASRLEEIIRLGISRIHVSLYGPADGAYITEEIAREAIARMSAKLEIGVKAKDVHARANTKYYASHHYAGATISLAMEDFNQAGIGYSSRLQDSNSKLASYQRKGPCQSPVDQVLIDINGNYLPCCNIHTSDRRYQDYTIANITDAELIVDAYFTKEFDFWRKGCSYSPPLFAVCRSCSRADPI